tara:strand:+ start:1562 stop:2500 length:939 start_codon:yes stop_codon:yes gene_type:complete
MSVPILHVPGLMRVTGPQFNVANLWGQSSKVKKKAAQLGYHPMIQYLSPHRMAAQIAQTDAGKQIIAAVEDKFTLPEGLLLSKIMRHTSCPRADDCALACLAIYAGHLRFEDCQLFEFAKTCMFLADTTWYLKRLVEEVQYEDSRNPFVLACRLNGGSDVMWERYHMEAGWKNIFEATNLDCVQFYDYTKIPGRMYSYLDGELPGNYSLTFSRGSTNWSDCLQVLARGGNVAVVCREVPDFEHAWWETPSGQQCEFIDGNAHDFRFLDPQGGHIVALPPQGTEAKEDDSGFVLDSWSQLDERGVYHSSVAVT